MATQRSLFQFFRSSEKEKDKNNKKAVKTLLEDSIPSGAVQRPGVGVLARRIRQPLVISLLEL